ncbi:MAG TPA: hypothetical protein VIY48_17565 [Candidatus Paceibacterota bacterium]
MALLVPGVPTAMFGKLDDEFRLRGRIALTEVADKIKELAKFNASSQGWHQYGTPTPATPGQGPAQISGTLVKSIDRSPVTREVFGYLCQVGTAAGMYPSYGSGIKSKASSKYGYILEVVGCRDGSRYPFLYRAAELGFNFYAPIIYKKKYGDKWARLI